MKYEKLIRLFLISPIAALVAASTSAQEAVVVTDADIVGDVTWTADNVYQLDGKVFVEDGETLTIEAGTRIEGLFVEGGGVNASALIVARGGQIFANGTAENPIVFTSELDDGTLGPGDRGLWGGLIVLGRAVINSPVEEGEAINEDNVEGIDPVTEPRGIFGGDDDEDDSGVIRYVSIRHGGAVIGADNEINGLTLGAVGRGTTVEFVEVFANLDDGIEFFGGTVNTRYMVSAFCGDDAFDYDQGFRGNGQFWFAIQDGEGNYAGEHDGDIGTNDNLPITLPHIYNATYIGAGADAPANENHTFLIRDNAGTKYYNSIFTDFTNTAVDVADDGVQRLAAGDVELADNIWFGFGAGTTAAEIANANAQPVFDAVHNNRIIDPMLGGISRTADGGLDPRPVEGSPALGAGRSEIANGFFSDVAFQGAFGDINWAAPWTVLHTTGILTGEGAGVPDYPLAEEADFVVDSETVAVGEDDEFAFGWQTEAGETYQVYSTGTLSPPDWQPVGDPIEGDGTVMTFSESILGEASKFYQIQVQ